MNTTPATGAFIRETVIESAHKEIPIGSPWYQSTPGPNSDTFDNLAKRRQGARNFTRHNPDHFSHETVTSVRVTTRTDYYRTKPTDWEEVQS